MELEELKRQIVKLKNSSYKASIQLIRGKDTGIEQYINEEGLSLIEKQKGAGLVEDVVVLWKTDLRSRFWQLQMIKHFIFELVFKTRNGGYKILITLFGLIGTPITVIALMNKIFFSIVVTSLVSVLIDNISFIYQA